MRFLFFFVHPSKFHLFKNTINALISNGHHVEILITSKDVLEQLVIGEGWNYKNIFPEGRKMKYVPPYISSGINFFRTIIRLFKYTNSKKYDLFITDDLLVYVGKFRKIPSIVFNDDDLRIVRQYSLILRMADHILAPEITDLGPYNDRKIGFPGYKELAYLHPDIFEPDINIIKKFNPELSPYYILRLVSLRSYHDVGMKGLSNVQVHKIINTLQNKGKVYISAERQLPDEFQNYQLRIDPLEIAHVLYFAELFVGDSQTMTSEAAVLGTPAFRCNDFVGKISVMEEKEEKYGLTYNFPTSEFEEMLIKIREFITASNIKDTFYNKRMLMLKDKINLSSFMTWLFENFPKSVSEIKSNPSLIDQYKTIK